MGLVNTLVILVVGLTYIVILSLVGWTWQSFLIVGVGLLVVVFLLERLVWLVRSKM